VASARVEDAQRIQGVLARSGRPEVNWPIASVTVKAHAGEVGRELLETAGLQRAGSSRPGRRDPDDARDAVGAGLQLKIDRGLFFSPVASVMNIA
jgi:hypothetical protein